MKKLGLLIFIFSVINFAQQEWYYDFGTETGSFTSGVGTDFLPDPPTGGGIARVRVGTQGGSFNLEDQRISFGSDAYLRIEAPTGGSVNKFSLYGYKDALPFFTLRFTIRFGDADGTPFGANSGTFYLFGGSGTSFSNNGGFTGNQVFTGLRFSFGNDGAITTNARVGSIWTANGISETPFTQGEDYIVEIYGNNSANTESYNYGDDQTIAANSIDIWVNGVLLADDLGKAQLPDTANIDSWMFYGENSPLNVANIFLDDISYSNDLSSEPLPVELTFFSASTAGSNVNLNWSTATEVNNYGFDVERSVIMGQWEKIGFISGSGNSNTANNYSFIDDKVISGKYLYRLKQIDNDGKFEYSKTIEVNVNGVNKFELSQNYPNPFNPVTTISFILPQAGIVNLALYNILGQEIKTLLKGYKEAGTHSINLNASELESGVYIYKLETNGLNLTRKMTLVK